MVKIILIIILTSIGINCEVKGGLRNSFESKKDVAIKSSENKINLKLETGELLIGNRKEITTKKSNNTIKNIVYEFLGIPFGQIPIKEKRFQFALKLTKMFDNIKPTKTYNMVYNATFYRPSCMQEYDLTFGSDFYGSKMWNPPYNRSEDCLYFNIWIPVTKEQDELIYINESAKYTKTENINEIKYLRNAFLFDSSKPKKYIENDDEKRTTLFWIYGGSFNSGSSNLKITDGTLLSSFENVIVITSNYRVGPFGFLYLNSSKIPGNAGLSDQILAIEWYREKYLNLFGGSTNNLCLFGESSGSMSLHNLLISKKNHLFNRLIFQSSSSYLDLSYRKPQDALTVSLDFIKKVGCFIKKQNINERKYSIDSSSQILIDNTDEDENEYYSDIKIKALKIKDNIKKSKLNKKYMKKTESEDLSLDNLNIDLSLSCLYNLDATILSEKQWEIDFVNEYLKMQFVPTSDFFDILSIDPSDYDFIRNGNKDDLNHDILVGFNQNEGSYFTFYLYNERFFSINQEEPILTSSSNSNNQNEFKKIKYNNEFIYERLLEALKTKYPVSQNNEMIFDSDKFNQHFYNKYIECVSNIYTNVNNIYLNDHYNETFDFNLNSKMNQKSNSANLAWYKFNKIIGDIIFSCPSIKLANKYSELRPYKSYFYKFNKRSFGNPWPKWLGVMHGYEIEYVFGVPFLHVNTFDDTDRIISMIMMNYWANFAKTGKLFTEYESKPRKYFVDFSLNSIQDNYNSSEDQEYNQFNSDFKNCDFFNSLSKHFSYVSRFDFCNEFRSKFSFVDLSADSTKPKASFLFVITIYFNFISLKICFDSFSSCF